MPESNKKSFIMYSNYRKFLSKLPDKDIADLIKAIFCFVEEEEIPELSPSAELCFIIISDQIKRDMEKYEKVCEQRAIAGRLGGMKTQEKRKKEEEKEEEKDNQAKGSKTKQMVANASKCQQKVAKGSKTKQMVANASKCQQKVAKGSKTKQMGSKTSKWVANQADNDNENDIDNDIDNDNDKENGIAIDKDIAIDIYKNKNKDIAIDIYKNNIYKKKKNTQKKKKNYSTEFECFWEVYPRKSDKGEAYKKYLTRLKDGWSPEQLLTAAKKYRAQIITNRTDQRYIKLCKTFLSDTTPFADYLTKTERQGVSNDAENPYAEWKDGANG